MHKVILDTNFLMEAARPIDIFSCVEKQMHTPFEFIVPQAVLDELQKFANGKSKKARAAKLAFVLVKQRAQPQSVVQRFLFARKEIPLKILPSSEKHADDAIVKIAEGATVATLDKGLQKRLPKGVRVLSNIVN